VSLLRSDILIFVFIGNGAIVGDDRRSTRLGSIDEGANFA
jgi:hypothetical protein